MPGTLCQSQGRAGSGWRHWAGARYLALSRVEAHAGREKRGPRPPPPHTSAPRVRGPWGRAGGRTLRPVSPTPSRLQTADQASSGRAVPCAAAAGLGPAVTPSAGSAAAWMATQGPPASRVSRAPEGLREGYVLLSPTPGWDPLPTPHTQSRLGQAPRRGHRRPSLVPLASPRLLTGEVWSVGQGSAVTAAHSGPRPRRGWAQPHGRAGCSDVASADPALHPSPPCPACVNQSAMVRLCVRARAHCVCVLTRACARRCPPAPPGSGERCRDYTSASQPPPPPGISASAGRTLRCPWGSEVSPPRPSLLRGGRVCAEEVAPGARADRLCRQVKAGAWPSGDSRQVLGWEPQMRAGCCACVLLCVSVSEAALDREC